jgi:hypothetical protein
MLSMAQRAKEKIVNKSKSTVKILADQRFMQAEGNDLTFPSIRDAYKHISQEKDDGVYIPVRIYRPMTISTESIRKIVRG